MQKKNEKPLRRKIVLRLPDLDPSKSSVLNRLSSPNSRRDLERLINLGIPIGFQLSGKHCVGGCV
jgi:hypothetical protein